MSKVQIRQLRSRVAKVTQRGKELQERISCDSTFSRRSRHIIKKRGKVPHLRRQRTSKYSYQLSTVESSLEKNSEAISLVQPKLLPTHFQFSKLFNPKFSTNFCNPQTQELLLSSEQKTEQQVSCNISQLLPYLNTIGEHLFKQESNYSLPTLVYNQYFGPAERYFFVKMICDYCCRFNFKIETNFLAVNIFHRICTASSFEKYHSSLKAVASLFVAAKYQEIAIPKVEVFSQLDPSLRIQDYNILKLQSLILIHLQFNLGLTSPLHFLDLLTTKYQIDSITRSQLNMLCRATLMSEALSLGRGSLLALTCLHIVIPNFDPSQQLLSDNNEQINWRVLEMRKMGLLC